VCEKSNANDGATKKQQQQLRNWYSQQANKQASPTNDECVKRTTTSTGERFFGVGGLAMRAKKPNLMFGILFIFISRSSFAPLATRFRQQWQRQRRAHPYLRDMQLVDKLMDSLSVKLKIPKQHKVAPCHRRNKQ